MFTLALEDWISVCSAQPNLGSRSAHKCNIFNLAQRIDFGEVHDVFICQKVLRRLEELDNYVIERQVLDPILVIRARLHYATANELQKW